MADRLGNPRAQGATISKPSIARSTAMMSSLTMASRVTGFLRLWATAYALGASGLMSAYSIANNLPNMVFELVAGGIISSLFIPTFMELKESRTEEEAWKFTSHVFNLAVLGLGVLGIVGTLFPAPFVWTQTFRMAPEQADKVIPAATFFFRFFALQVVLYGAGAVISALLNSQRKYFWPAVGPIFNNLVAIGAMFAFVGLGGKLTGGSITSGLAPVVLAVGTSLAVLVMFAVQLPAVFRTGWRYSWGLGLSDPGIRHLFALAGPTVIYVATNLVAVSFRNSCALAVSPEGVSILTYAWVFYQLPYGILAVALATAVFTELADAAGRNDLVEFKEIFSRGLRATTVLMLSASGLMIALATPLVSLYRVGAFKATDIPPVVGALRWWVAGLIFYALFVYVLRAFYSLKDTKTPMLVNLVLTALIHISLYWVLSTGIGSWRGIGVNAMPIADAIFYACVSSALLFLLRRRIGGFDMRGIASMFARMVVAACVGGAAAWGVSTVVTSAIHGVGGSIVAVLAGGLVGGGVILGAGRVLGVTEVAEATAMLTSRLRRKGSR
jgi:putative peptidoglycan lipid II flippase